jgi:CDP-diacylglycerol--serine O-phosphatidyltransferase
MQLGHERKRRFKGLSFNRMIPNILTLLALVAGLTAIRYALDDRWEHAILAVVAAGVLDGLDGRIARLLKGASKFGAELDSLSDFVCFGVAPPMLLYLWSMHDAGRIGWALVMLFTICCGLRLARFNVALEDQDAPVWKSRFFTGVPSPAGAGLVLLPMVMSFQLGDGFFRDPWMVGVFLVGVAALMVSTIPTYSFKKLKIGTRWILPTMLIAGAVTVFLISAPWMTLSVVGFFYLASIPVSIRDHRRLLKGEGAPPEPATE